MGSIANSLRRQLPTAFAAVAVVFLIALAIGYHGIGSVDHTLD